MRVFQALSLVLILSLVSTGCSVGMAHKQPPKKNLDVLKTGTSRAAVIAELGAPTWNETKFGKNIDIFSFTQGYSDLNRTGRVITHGVLDVCTLGIWEVVGTPVEAIANGTPIKLQVFYDEYDKVTRFKVFQGEGEFEELLVDSGFALESEKVGRNHAGPVAAPPAQSPEIWQGGRRWALVIGVSQYKDSRVPDLRYASKDAITFRNWLVSPEGGRYAPSRVKLLVDSEATSHAIKEALFVWLKQALEEDIVTIYFSGHGSPESPDAPWNLFLLPYDVDYDNVATTGFPMWDVETAIKRFIQAKRVVIIADACHAGGVGNEFDVARKANKAVSVAPAINAGIQNITQTGEGVCVITASDDKQFSQEGVQWGGGHGVFTWTMLQGLQGDADYSKDSAVTLGELTSYLSEMVRTQTNNAQSPTVAGRYDPAMTIGKPQRAGE